MISSKQLVTDLALLVNSSSIPDGLLVAAGRIGKEDLRTIAYRILSWLKIQHKWKKERGLPMNSSHSWSTALQRLLAEDACFASFLEVEGVEFRFHRSLGEEQRNELKSIANAMYNPRLIQ